MIDNLVVLIECLAIMYVVVRALQLDRAREWFSIDINVSGSTGSSEKSGRRTIPNPGSKE